MGRKKTEPAGIENPFAENPPEKGRVLGNFSVSWSYGDEHTRLTRAADSLYVDVGGYQIAVDPHQGLRVQAGRCDRDLLRLPLL